MPGEFGLTEMDYEHKTSMARYPIPTLSGANWVGVVGTLIPALVTEVGPLVYGPHVKQRILAERVLTGAGRPAIAEAQREIKGVMTYQDSVTGRKYNIEIPGISLANMQEASDLIDLTVPAVADVVSAFEGLARSPAGNNVTVLQIKVVGRSL